MQIVHLSMMISHVLFVCLYISHVHFTCTNQHHQLSTSASIFHFPQTYVAWWFNNYNVGFITKSWHKAHYHVDKK